MRDLNDSYLYVLVIRRGSLAAAAREVGLPPSSVSRRLARLEERLGVQLLLRTTRKVTPTEAGRVYYERAAPALDELVSTEEDLSGIDGEIRGLVRLTAPEDLRWLGGVWLEFAQAHPHVELHVTLTNRYVDLIAEGIDAALRGGLPEQTEYISRKVGTYRLCMVASPSFLDAFGAIESMQDLSGAPVLFAHVKATGLSWLRPTRKLFGIPVRAGLVVNDLTTMHLAALGGLGLAVLPEQIVQADLLAGALREILPQRPRVEVPLYLVRPGQKACPRPLQALLDFTARRLPEWLGSPAPPPPQGRASRPREAAPSAAPARPGRASS